MIKKRIISLLIAVSLILPAALCYAENNQVEEKGEAEILYDYSKLAIQQLDLSLEHLSGVRALAEKGKYVEALQAYKPIFFDNIRDMATKGLRPLTGKSNINLADDLLDNYVNRSDDSGLNHRVYLGGDGSWNWYPEDEAFAKYGLRFGFMEELIYAYPQTGDVKYLNKAISIWEDFDTNFYEQYKIQHAKDRYWYGNLIEFNILGRLVVGGRIFKRIDGLLAASKFNHDELYNAYSDIAFAKMCYAFPVDAARIQITTDTPNQFTYAVNALVTASKIFGDFKPVTKRYNEGIEALKGFLLNQYLQDGADQEMSFHYNYELPSLVKSIDRMFSVTGENPDWLQRVREAGIGRVRMLSSVVTPLGETPSIAKDYEAEDVYSKLNAAAKATDGDEVADSVINYMFGDKTKEPPSFTSIAFPYAGYYVMRQSWEPDSHYMFMMGSRFGAGHTESNKLDVQYTAFGERLLTSSSSSYSTLPEHEAYDNYIKSTTGNNTITVDGLSQRRVIDNYSDFDLTEGGLWHTSADFDLAESTYSNGYNPWIGEWDGRKSAKINDVTHSRRTIFDKENEIGIVIDNLKADQRHTYQLNWNFAKKFNSYDSVAANAEEKWIKTCLDDGRGGVELYNFYDGELGHEVYVGEHTQEETKGWYLEKYGTDFKPSLHTETVFSGVGNQMITTLINPTYNNKSKIIELEENGEGFSALLENGNRITLITGKEKRNNLSYDDLAMKAAFLYAVKEKDGSIKGIAVNVASVSFAGTPRSTTENFEFTVKDGKFEVISEIKAPTRFKWINSGNGIVPDYGYDESYKFMY